MYNIIYIYICLYTHNIMYYYYCYYIYMCVNDLINLNQQNFVHSDLSPQCIFVKHCLTIYKNYLLRTELAKQLVCIDCSEIHNTLKNKNHVQIQGETLQEFVFLWRAGCGLYVSMCDNKPKNLIHYYQVERWPGFVICISCYRRIKGQLNSHGTIGNLVMYRVFGCLYTF